MPTKAGPWQLDRVKDRLRREQVAREQAVSLRYRQQEEDGKVKENTNQEFGGNQRAFIFLVCLLVFLLFVCVLALCTVVFVLLKKDNDR
jgi:hypothetical protein